MRAAMLGLVLAVGGATALAAESATDQVQRLIERLGNGGFRDREAASRELDGLGEPALEALRKAAATGDPETRRRAADLVERISTRLATARILAPTTVEFNYQDRLLGEAVADLARRTGATINLHDATPNKFRNRKITAATAAPTPFWDAIELLCRKAELHEWDGLTPVPGLALPQQQGTQFIGQGGLQGQVMILNRSGRSRSVTPGPNTIVLLDGPSAPTPQSRGIAVRVRVLPVGTPFAAGAIGVDEIILPLQVSPEPKLSWQSAATVRIDRAIDDNGRSLVTAAALPMAQPDDEELIILNGMVMQSSARRSGPVGIRVQRGEKPAGRLTELAGAVVAEVRVAEPLAVVDAPLKAAGQTIRGNHGVVLHVKSISRGTNGDVTLSADVRVPLDIQMPMLGGAMNINGAGFAQQIVIQGGGAIQIGPGRTGMSGQAPAPGATDYQGLSVEGAKGRRFTATKGVVETSPVSPDGVTLRVSATFHPADKEEPVRLVFTATRPTTIDIPFQVKDVPLP